MDAKRIFKFYTFTLDTRGWLISAKCLFCRLIFSFRLNWNEKALKNFRRRRSWLNIYDSRSKCVWQSMKINCLPVSLGWLTWCWPTYFINGKMTWSLFMILRGLYLLIKKEEKEKSWRKSVNIARLLKIYKRNDLTSFTQVAVFGRINCK